MTHVIARLQTLRSDQRGAAMVEFAIVLPLLLLLLLGSIEIVQLVEAHRRVTHVASTVADLVSQQRIVDRSGIDDVFVAGELVMAPLPADRLGMRIASYVADSSGRVRRDWMDQGPVPYAGNAPEGLPPGYSLPREEGVIVADVSYTYTPLLKWALAGDLKLEKRMLLRPRVSEKVVRAGS